MKHLYYIAQLCCMGYLIAACNSHTEEVEQQQGIPLQFTCPTGRGTQTSAPENIGVMAYHNGSETPNFMNNQLITKNGSTWSYEPVKYWPQGTLSFYAYSPYADGHNGISVSGMTLIYTTPNNIASHPDLLTALPLIERTADEGKVAFVFDHRLACVSFEISNATTPINLPDQLVLKGIYTSGGLSLDAGQWSLTGKEELILDYTLPPIGTHYLMLLPQELTDDSKVELKRQGTILATVKLNGNNTTQWEIGKQYVYKLTLNQ